MAIRSASISFSRGFSLPELLLASAIGLIMTAVLVQTLVVTQRNLTAQIKQLYLRQSLADVLRYLSDDIRRAGYNGSGNEIVTLAGSSPLLNSSDGELSYIYRFEQGYTISAIKHDAQKNKLLICSARRGMVSASNACQPFFSLLDDKQVHLKSFQLSQKELSRQPLIYLTTLTLTAELASGSEPVTASSTLFVRNQPSQLSVGVQ
ncbi:PilW family protein [Vibrio sp. SCSIO 43137]|uniref:PilW family protein n=1 Tax=Vibrio sp. SCSIO 43137 TaxID=3021011 RepID=UPI002307F4C2|nr:prepilin-type N-terminal cleavage/methylation domain-containing protein [Vibrio sp. SCSIO 43137]WCE30364.1 prepilin-type N-terminal cleavage/methylation domain-containing protein [Vibrio sp. SCSIO 43137]